MKNNEVVRIEKPGKSSSQFELRWRVTSLCNYQCEFCIQGDQSAHSKMAKGESSEKRKEICDAINAYIETLKEYKTIQLSLIGGEVSILKDFPVLLEKLAGADYRGEIDFNITTNLSQPASYFCKLFDIVQKAGRKGKCRKLHLAASYYSAYTSWEEFQQKLLQIERHLKKLKMQGYCRLFLRKGPKMLRHRMGMTGSLSVGYPILTNNDYKRYEELKIKMKNRLVAVEPIRIRQFPTDLDENTIDKLQKEKSASGIRVTDIEGNVICFENIQALGLAMEGADRFCPKGYLCDAGMHSIWINAFGEIYRCPAIGSAMRMGNILDKHWERLEQMTVCEADHCSCNEFGMIEKPEYGKNI